MRRRTSAAHEASEPGGCPPSAAEVGSSASRSRVSFAAERTMTECPAILDRRGLAGARRSCRRRRRAPPSMARWMAGVVRSGAKCAAAVAAPRRSPTPCRGGGGGGSSGGGGMDSRRPPPWRRAGAGVPPRSRNAAEGRRPDGAPHQTGPAGPRPDRPRRGTRPRCAWPTRRSAAPPRRGGRASGSASARAVSTLRANRSAGRGKPEAAAPPPRERRETSSRQMSRSGPAWPA